MAGFSGVGNAGTFNSGFFGGFGRTPDLYIAINSSNPTIKASSLNKKH